MSASLLPPPQPGRSDRAKGRLLEAALKLFGEKGPRGATVREIAAASGQNLAAIAYYFGSKEKLYHAVLEGIVRELKNRIGDVLEEVRQFQAAPRKSPAAAAALVGKMLRAIYLRLLSRNEASAIVQLVVREQTQPSAGFHILYEQGFRQLHESLCWLVGLALGRNPREREVIVRTHMLMGQVYFFAMSRQAILQRLGWKDLEGKNAEMVAAVLEEHLQALLKPVSSNLSSK